MRYITLKSLKSKASKIIILLVIIFLTIPSAYSQAYRPRNRYIQGSYSLLKTEYDNQTYNSDYAFSLGAGRTFFFHKQAIYDNFWIGLDWMVLDFSLAHFEKDIEANLVKFNQMEAGTHVGPSFWYSPVKGISLNYYFRFAPTLSRIKFKDSSTKLNEYAQYWVTGASFSYKIFAFGLEYKWGGYNKSNVKTNGPRFYLGVRLW